MRSYIVKIPKWITKLYKKRLWKVEEHNKVVYLTFDDGPTTDVTDWVLSQLEEYNAKATFFCIGKNVINHPDIYRRILESGHRVGNHTHNHLNGYKASKMDYVANVKEASKCIDSSLVRPPYGRLKSTTAKILQQNYTIVMWDVLSGDFDTSIDGEEVYLNTINNIEPGSIVVFHDSVKAEPRLRHALPLVLEHCVRNEYVFKSL